MEKFIPSNKATNMPNESLHLGFTANVNLSIIFTVRYIIILEPDHPFSKNREVNTGYTGWY